MMLVEEEEEEGEEVKDVEVFSLFLLESEVIGQ